MAKRRPNGTGTVKTLANGTCQIAVMVGRKPDGKRNIKYFTGKNPTEARRKMKAYMDALDAGMDMESNYTLEEWSEVFMKLHSPNIKPVTAEHYRHTLNLINRHLGSRKLRDLKPMDVELLLLRLRDEGRSDSALSHVRGLLYQIFERAVGNDLVTKNIVQYAPKLRKIDHEEKECFTDEEVQLLMDKLPMSKIGLGIRVLLGCGLRTQELLALTQNHIEEDGSVIHVRQAVSLVKGMVTISSPKSYSSIRDIPVPENIRDCVLALRDTNDKYIFQSPVAEQPINPSTFRKYYREMLESIPGVRYLSPHACRHTYVSTLHALGVDAATLQSLVGHSSQLMTQHYLHVHPSVQQDAVARFAHAFARNQKPALNVTIKEAEDLKDERDRAYRQDDRGKER